MALLTHYVEDLLSCGRGSFSSQEAQTSLGLSAEKIVAAARRLIKKKRLVSPRRGFYLILRPEDRFAGAPDPEYWIDPVMKYLQLDYRVSLLRAAAWHGASHQAAMVFQVVAPKQLRAIEIGYQRIQFIYQFPEAFTNTNRPEWLIEVKTKSGFVKSSGVELTLLDCTRYYRKAAGLNGAAQIVKDIGSKAVPEKLASAARFYENTTVCRLGFLLSYNGHIRQSKALEPFASKAKSFKPLNPSIKPLSNSISELHETNTKWMLEINDCVELDY